MLFNDLFKEKNVEKEQRESNQAKDYQYKVESDQFFENHMDNYNHPANISISFRTLSPYCDWATPFNGIEKTVTMYGPEVLDGYDCYNYKQGNDWFQFWYTLGDKHDVLLVKNNQQVISKISQKQFKKNATRLAYEFLTDEQKQSVFAKDLAFCAGREEQNIINVFKKYGNLNQFVKKD